MKKKLLVLMTVLVLILGLVPSKISYAASDGTIIIEGLEVHDVVEVYRICNYMEDEDKYVWASAVTTWMTIRQTGRHYADLTTAQFLNMSAADSKEFCELLLDGLKNTSTGVANLQGSSFVYEVGGGNTVTTAPGYYVVLPKGSTRVYSLKWLTLAPGEEKTITYTENDYSAPSISSSIVNMTANRGSVADVPLAELDDTLRITSQVVMPTYTNMYSAGKRLMNLVYVIPKGMEYVANSFTISAGGDIDEGAFGEGAFSLMVFSGATLYKDNDNNLMFFGKDDYFYDISGNNLVGPSGTEELALETFNSIHGTAYEYEQQTYSTVGGEASVVETEEKKNLAEEVKRLDSNGEEEVAPEVVTPEGTQEGDSQEDTQVETIGTEEVDTSNILYRNKNVSILVVALDTSVDLTTVETTLDVTKNKYSTDKGWYDVLTSLSYSVSSLDSNKISNVSAAARAGSYGIRVTSCMGYADSYLKTEEEILATAPRMLDDRFIIYRKMNTISGDINEAVTQISNEDKDKVQLIYDSDLNVTTVYKEYATLNVDQEGTTALGGIETGEYLVVQVDHVPGYALSEESILIEAQDWRDDNYMKGNCVFNIVWLDFKTVYLPATGEDGMNNAYTTGILICSFAFLVMAQIINKKKFFICN